VTQPPWSLPSRPATPDHVLRAFLSRQREDIEALVAESDLVRVEPLAGDPPSRYVVHFACKGLLRQADGTVVEGDHFAVGIAFPSDYLRRVEPVLVTTFLGPRNAFHPNISDVYPFICIGPIAPGTPLVELVSRCFDVITGKRVTMDERNALNHAACQWSRDNRERFPIDRRGLKRRTSDRRPTVARVEG
jgi:hypothetical protein